MTNNIIKFIALSGTEITLSYLHTYTDIDSARVKMNLYKLFLVYFGIALIPLIRSQDANGLCALNKLGNKCVCEYRTCEKTRFPELHVDCRWLDLKSFPKTEQFPNDVFHLDLSQNAINGIDGQLEGDNLFELVLSYNEIGPIFHPFLNAPNLERLDLSHNEISVLDSNIFDGLVKLKFLDLSFNKLMEMSYKLLEPLANLQSLNLGYNPLGDFFMETSNIFQDDFGLTPNITYINLDRIGLREIKSDFFGDTKSLMGLSMADNNFNEIPPIPASVHHFDFSGNNVSILAVRFLNYHSMKTLKLNRLKNLNEIDRYAFYNMQELEELYLENCPNLRELNGMAFGVINPGDETTLKKISFARSGLTKMNDTFFHLFKKLEHLDLQNNPWRCDCEIVWMHLLNGTIYHADNMRCVSPTNLRNRKIMELSARYLPSCFVSTKSLRLQKLLIPILAVMVILLLCLIVYLIYMGPLLYKNYRGIGPESPYQEVTVLREYRN